jgi:hypothetical protein
MFIWRVQVRHPADRRVKPGEPEAEGHRDLHRGREARVQPLPGRAALRGVPQGVPGRVHVQRGPAPLIPHGGGRHGDLLAGTFTVTSLFLFCFRTCVSSSCEQHDL